MRIDLVAWYAAVVSTAAFVLAVFVALRDRANLRLEVKRDLEGFGDQVAPGKKFVVVTVANRGRRPVTVNTVSFRLHKGKGEILLGDSLSGGPIEIAEGKSHPFAANQDKFPFDDVRYAVVVDQTGRSWKKRVRFP